ncbi:MAG: hypothetical protein LLF97_13260 [Planctomycetaceae bacterium]|nr:hypothetical protein [Planctomycetaceae bacterium]
MARQRRIPAINSTTEMRAAVRLGVPMVNLSETLGETDTPRVTVDYYAMGRLAAEPSPATRIAASGLLQDRGSLLCPASRRGIFCET